MQVRPREAVLSLIDRFPPGAVGSTDHPCAFWVKNVPRSRKVASANEGPMNGGGFLRALAEQLPFVLIWLGEPPESKIRGHLQSQVSANDGATFWTASGADSLQRLANELYEGAWGMFFYAEPPPRLPLPPVPLLPKSEGSEAVALLAVTGAAAAVVSYQDNLEWLVVCDEVSPQSWLQEMRGRSGVSLKEEAVTRFLNVDLDLRAEAGLEELLGYLAPSVLVLYRTESEAALELNQQYGSLEETVAGLVALIRSLPPQAMKLWERCELRRMNIGIQAGSQPHQALFVLSKDAVASLADVRAEVMFTVYAPLG